MLSKIYYGLGAGVISIYLLSSILSIRSSGTPQPFSVGAMRMERGKYVYVPPSSTYPSSSNPYSSGSKSSSRSSSYPSSGGFSGGK